jgi:hypothetical protein
MGKGGGTAVELTGDHGSMYIRANDEVKIDE